MEDTSINDFPSETNIEKYQLPAVIAGNEKTVKKSFWIKFIRVARFIPFAPDLLAAYFCALDPHTPTRVRAVLLAALAYFILPMDLIPDFIAGLGFSDDATVLTAAISIVAGHITKDHKSKAQTTLSDLANRS